MNDRVKELSRQAIGLTPGDREILLENILASLAEPDASHEAAWMAEIEKRIASDERGEARMVAAEDVFARHRKP